MAALGCFERLSRLNGTQMGEDLEKETVKRLGRSVTELRRQSDLEGLLRLETQATALAATLNGRTRRKAERIAQRASSAVDSVRRDGGETEDERAARVVREMRDARWRDDEARAAVLERLTSLLHLLLYDGSPLASEFALLRGLSATDADGFLQIELPAFVTVRSSLLVGGFEQSRRIFAKSGAPMKRHQVERVLKATAVDLVSSGAEVRGLASDIVPLLAYALLASSLPSAVDTSEDLLDEVDDLVLGVSDEISSIPASGRPIFISLLRLSILLGEAEAYAKRHGLASLSSSARR
jgi:hypothetical protein